jgi:mannose-6-phosphate isomerase-like protein (cupin superfamily)
MMSMEKFTKTSILEDYCLGLLTIEESEEITLAAKQFPDLLKKIQEIEQSLISFTTINTRPLLKYNILAALENIPAENNIDINNPPAINRNSDLMLWREAVKNIEPNSAPGKLKTNFIKYTRDFQLCVAWLEDELHEGEHHADEFAESFFILEGSCECNIGGQIIHLKAGDYLDIPFDTTHTIKSTSINHGYVKAILQRKKLAA